MERERNLDSVVLEPFSEVDVPLSLSFVKLHTFSPLFQSNLLTFPLKRGGQMLAGDELHDDKSPIKLQPIYLF